MLLHYIKKLVKCKNQHFAHKIYYFKCDILSYYLTGYLSNVIKTYAKISILLNTQITHCLCLSPFLIGN